MYWITDGNRQLSKSESEEQARAAYAERLGEGYDNLRLVHVDDDGRERIMAQEHATRYRPPGAPAPFNCS